ncbi:DUF1302 family protein [Kordiimonas lacus]|uniref:Porin n=1 Tax=Kordiimonas lacus TaxID=637679 RepID=A0A1G7E9X6_9PROT|nr:DUF1302 family protein [Kordiimonas lacus]SDE60447.1 hypothetical protein SAMN04488071_3355 [Kordiimonas lacus]
MRLVPSIRTTIGALILATAPVSADMFENLEVSGIAETSLALGLSDGSLQKSTVTLTPEVHFDLSSRTRVTLIGRLRSDLKDTLEPGRPDGQARATLSDRWHIGSHLEAELREAYLDTEIGATFLRLGKQQIVWGQADGLKVLDVLNPQSFAEFILPDFEDSRIPLWAANAEIPVGDLTLQLIWIPDTTYDEIPEPGSAFAFTSPLIVPSAPPGVPVTFADADKPGNAFTDSDVAAKLSAFTGGWDLSLNYAYHYADRPVVRRIASAQGITIRQNYERSHLLGGTFSNVFGDITVRGEIGYATNKYFRTDDMTDQDGVVRANDFSYVLGADYAGFTDWFLSTQIFQSHLSKAPLGLVRSGTETRATFLARRSFMNEALLAEALLIQSLNDGDGLLQASLVYEWRSNIRLKAGADIFYGKRDGLFGQFRNKDRISVGMEVSF